ncbi:U2 small nuclear ribonucleoprotein A [Cokeromyces recurvatus]|uniref:U2 small nuclear ribonucleoprotein A n=1 Tax=Cokeromyces recurvatus TaxID=90255 RepID=UPI00221EEBA8|nr:U2 small nuclear ribonucleoprotein A [Cokeromyces recurvatus]KAI7904728.1 U2 small nuclear ribonucleoprotein A [Cokeromyces recurvatus]
MKLTADLINNSLSHINPLGDRELILRDLKIPAIENLGVTKDLNDAIDFTNNDLRVLGNFPRLNRLQHLLLNNNRISKIDSELSDYIPNVHTIILTNNAIQELGDLEPLVRLKKLTHLSIMDNPVTKKSHYRLYLIHKLPQLRVLDFNKVKLSEKQEAKKLFSKSDGSDNDLAKSITDNKTKTFEPGEGLNDKKDSQIHGLTPEEQLKIKEALKQATSLDEISRLERLLKAGHVPTTGK